MKEKIILEMRLLNKYIEYIIITKLFYSKVKNSFYFIIFYILNFIISMKITFKFSNRF